VQTKNAEKTSMHSASEVMQRSRSQLVYLVEREERATGSRTVAYENVATMIGRSASWVRSVFKGYADAIPDLVVGLNILTLYHQVCSRVELEAARESAEAAHLREQLHAAYPGIDRLVSLPPGEKEVGEGKEAVGTLKSAAVADRHR